MTHARDLEALLRHADAEDHPVLIRECLDSLDARDLAWIVSRGVVCDTSALIEAIIDSDDPGAILLLAHHEKSRMSQMQDKIISSGDHIMMLQFAFLDGADSDRLFSLANVAQRSSPGSAYGY